MFPRTINKRPNGLLWILWFKGAIAVFAILLGAWMLFGDVMDISHAFVRLGIDQIGSDATGMMLNFAIPYVPALKRDMVRAFAFGFVAFGIIKLFLIVELYRLEVWARIAAITFFILLLPLELAQVVTSTSVSVSKTFSIALNMLIIWYLWKVLPRELAKESGIADQE